MTREIATGSLPDGSPESSQGWGWRISVAEVAQDGAFSIFPDTDRVIAVIEGPGMDLVRPDGTILALEPFQPVRFSGEDPLDGRLRGGPLRDLNVMVLRGLFTAQMEIREGPCAFEATGANGGCLAILGLAGTCHLQAGDAEPSEMHSGDVHVLETQSRIGLTLSEKSRVAVIDITRT